MNNLMRATLVILISLSFLTSCTSETAKKVQKQIQTNLLEEKKAENQNLDKEALSEMNSTFEKTSKRIKSFVSKYDNWADSYYWKSDNHDDKPYNMIRLCGTRTLSDILIIEKRSSRPNSTDVVGYCVMKKKKNDKTSYILETSFYRNGKEILSRRELLSLSTVEELDIALEPFYERLAEAKDNVKKMQVKNLSKIKKMTNKS